MVITEGAVFSEELHNSSSLLFKSLAFDVENLVRRHAFILKIDRSVRLLIIKDNKAKMCF